jgi:hypothetical protein
MYGSLRHFTPSIKCDSSSKGFNASANNFAAVNTVALIETITVGFFDGELY